MQNILRKQIRLFLACLPIAVITFLVLSADAAGKPSPTTGTLAGKVTIFGTRTVIVGAKVTATNTTTGVSASALTGVTGTYRMSLAAGTYSVTCEATGYQAATVNGVTITVGVTTTVNFTMLPLSGGSGTLIGTVTDSTTNAALYKATVTATGTPGTFTVSTSVTGAYSLGLPEGTYTVTCSYPEYQTITTAGVIIAANATTTLTIALTPNWGTLTGAVTDSVTGAGIAGATVITDAGGYSAVTDQAGTYTITKIPAGTYAVTCSAPYYQNLTKTGVVITPLATTTVNAALTPTAGTLTGTVTDSATTGPVSGAVVTVSPGNYAGTTDSLGVYTIKNIPAGSYAVACTGPGYAVYTAPGVAVIAGKTTTLNIALTPVIISLTATPDSFVEGGATMVTFAANVTMTPVTYAWSQVKGPKVPLTPVSPTQATADVTNLSAAAETDIVVRLTVTDTDGNAISRDVTVAVQPADMYPVLGPNVQIGGSTTVAARFSYNGADWTLFNVGNALKATAISAVKGAVYSLSLPGVIHDIDVTTVNGISYALVADDKAGVAVVDITNPAAMTLVSVTPVNYYATNITWTSSSGTIYYNNTVSGTNGVIVSLETDGVSLYIADFSYGIHKTALTNVINALGPVKEADGTLKIDQEVFTLQYASETPWGGPCSLKLYGNKLFSPLGNLGLGIFDPVTMIQVGRYNLYTDVARTEDYFGPLDIAKVVSKDASGDLYLDDFTGLLDYRQVSYEILSNPALTPWADFDRKGGKWYYFAQDMDIALQGARTIAYLAYALGGVVAVDVTGYENATGANFLNAGYLGFFPAIPALGPSAGDTLPSSLLPYTATGMLQETGITAVKVSGDMVFATDHAAGLLIIDKASTPDLDWHGPNAPYNNDTDGIANNNYPDYEDIVSYDMSTGMNVFPTSYYLSPSLLVTGELNGHGIDLMLVEPVSLTAAGNVDVLECSGAGGVVFLDIKDIANIDMSQRFAIAVYFPTTDEIGAAEDGSATQAINIGHTEGVSATDRYLYVSDGPHGVSVWGLVDSSGFMTDSVHVVANTLQEEYPVTSGTKTLYPATHTVRNLIDLDRGKTWAQCTIYGMRGVPISGVEAGLGAPGLPLLLDISRTDVFEHYAEFTVTPIPTQDNAYDAAFAGNYAYVADGQNGITVYDITKDPSIPNSGFYVANIGYNQGAPFLGTVTGIELWTDPATNRTYAIAALNALGIGVIDITDPAGMKLVKTFESVEASDGSGVDVRILGDKAYITYESGGVLCYSMADLINAALTRPAALGQFRLQSVAGYETTAGNAYRTNYTVQNGRLHLYIGYGEAGVVKVDFTNPAAPVLVDRTDTVVECLDVAISNGRVFCADSVGGLVFFK